MDDIRLVVDEELDDVIIEVEPLYKVTVSKTGNGTIFPDGEGDFYYSENEISNIFALPDAGYIFEDISVNGTRRNLNSTNKSIRFIPSFKRK